MQPEQLLKSRHTVIETKITEQDILVIHSKTIFVHAIHERAASLLRLIIVLWPGKIPHLLCIVFLYHMPCHVIHGIIIIYTHKVQSVKCCLKTYRRNPALPYSLQKFRRHVRIFDIVYRDYDPVKIREFWQVIDIVFTIAVAIIPVPVSIAVEYIKIHICLGILYLLHESKRPCVCKISLPSVHEQCNFFHTILPPVKLRITPHEIVHVNGLPPGVSYKKTNLHIQIIHRSAFHKHIQMYQKHVLYYRFIT